MANSEVVRDLQAQIDGIMSKGNGAAFNHESGSANQGKAMLHSEDAVAERLSDSNAALKKIIALVNASDKSELAIRQRLNKEGFHDTAIEQSVEDAKRYGFIDDNRYAQVLIRSRISQCKGSAGIVRELSDNGIDVLDVPGWPYDFDITHEDEVNRALDFLQRKPPHSKNKREGAFRRLMQKGYPSSVASTAARIWSESQSN